MAGQHWNGWDHDHRISGYWSPRIQRALREMLTLKLLKSIPRVGGGRAGAAIEVRSVLRTLDRDGFAGVLTSLHLDGSVYGTWVALGQLKDGGITGAAMPPNLAEAFAKAKAKRFAMGADLLPTIDPVTLHTIESEADKVAAQILDTLGDKIARILADGWARDATVKEIARDLSAVVDDPVRAYTISVTETARSMVASSFDIYRRNGIGEWDWLDSPGACPYCLLKAAGGPYSLGDPGPPGHPRCRCAPAPRIDVPDQISPAAITGVNGMTGGGGGFVSGLAGIAGVAGTILTITGHTGSTSSIDTGDDGDDQDDSD